MSDQIETGFGNVFGITTRENTMTIPPGLSQDSPDYQAAFQREQAALTRLVTSVTERGDMLPAIENVITAIKLKRPASNPFIPTRYPYTYAYDYMRSHVHDFDLPDGISRGECSMVLTGWCAITGEDKETSVVRLANAYMQEFNIDPAEPRP